MRDLAHYYYAIFNCEIYREDITTALWPIGWQPYDYRGMLDSSDGTRIVALINEQSQRCVFVIRGTVVDSLKIGQLMEVSPFQKKNNNCSIPSSRGFFSMQILLLLSLVININTALPVIL